MCVCVYFLCFCIPSSLRIHSWALFYRCYLWCEFGPVFVLQQNESFREFFKYFIFSLRSNVFLATWINTHSMIIFLPGYLTMYQFNSYPLDIESHNNITCTNIYNTFTTNFHTVIELIKFQDCLINLQKLFSLYNSIRRWRLFKTELIQKLHRTR